MVLGTGGRPTRHASKCVCKGTGIDQETVYEGRIESILERLNKLELDHARSLQGKFKGSRQTWEELIAWATQDATAVANTTTEAILFPNVTIPANYMQDGRRMRGECAGKLSTTATPTMTWAIRFGGVAGTVLATTEAITMGSGVTNVNWSMKFRLQTRSNGATGTLLCFGELFVHTAAGTVLQNVFGVSGYDAPAAATVDLTADTALSITGDWSAASTSNTITGMDYGLESLN